ncbi:helix-turn-helix domain-containing protein [Thioclava sp. FTW29]|uniref:Helix-turn-helix domain-containing protein n=1 Tax=Thioclava litoralis TaxID=3076557 RepID=A0ABZ1E5R5_9RHOB|nr:helix-turn-helix domain-containing protein [Thioclava sp. FTW29]
MPSTPTEPPAEGRVARRQRRTRKALIDAACRVMSEKGVDAATMLEIAEAADMGAGTVYNYFKSKDDLAVAVLEFLMQDLAMRIESVTNTFSDSALVYACGVRSVLEVATQDARWHPLLNRSEVIADAMYRAMGPFAIRDMERATEAGRFTISDASLIWRLTSHALLGAALLILKGDLPATAKPEIVMRLLCMTGLPPAEAQDLALRDLPPVPDRLPA